MAVKSIMFNRFKSIFQIIDCKSQKISWHFDRCWPILAIFYLFLSFLSIIAVQICQLRIFWKQLWNRFNYPHPVVDCKKRSDYTFLVGIDIFVWSLKEQRRRRRETNGWNCSLFLTHEGAMNLEEEEKQMVGIDHAGQDCDLSVHCQDFFQCDSSIQNKICSQSRTRHLISMNINIDMLLKYSYKSAHFRTKKNGTSSGQIKILRPLL